MKLIVGLGNPGKKYEDTRHNIGFEAVKAIGEELGVGNYKEKFQGLIGEANYNGEKVLLLMPTTFMNLSGNSIIEVLNFYKISAEEDILIIYDDMDLDLGKMRIREKGSAGGHNGMKSSISHLGNKFLRIKLGIGKAKDKEGTINHVLGNFSKEEKEDVQEIIKKSVQASLELIKGQNIQKIMAKFN